jgi:hypothetical protein
MGILNFFSFQKTTSWVVTWERLSAVQTAIWVQLFGFDNGILAE